MQLCFITTITHINLFFYKEDFIECMSVLCNIDFIADVILHKVIVY